jgi:hypothetical protein
MRRGDVAYLFVGPVWYCCVLAEGDTVKIRIISVLV